MRLLASLGDYMYSYDEDTLYVHQYAASAMEFEGMSVEQTTEYPKNGSISLKFNTNGRKLALRIPGWCRSFTGACGFDRKIKEENNDRK